MHTDQYVDFAFHDHPSTLAQTTGHWEDIPCPDCVGGILVLRKSSVDDRLFYGCSKWGETACEGGMLATQEGDPLGVPGDRETRQLRTQVYVLSKEMVEDGLVESRREFYGWMRRRLGLLGQQWISHLTAAQCRHLLTDDDGELPMPMSLQEYTEILRGVPEASSKSIAQMQAARASALQVTLQYTRETQRVSWIRNLRGNGVEVLDTASFEDVEALWMPLKGELERQRVFGRSETEEKARLVIELHAAGVEAAFDTPVLELRKMWKAELQRQKAERKKAAARKRAEEQKRAERRRPRQKSTVWPRQKSTGPTAEESREASYRANLINTGLELPPTATYAEVCRTWEGVRDQLRKERRARRGGRGEGRGLTLGNPGDPTGSAVA